MKLKEGGFVSLEWYKEHLEKQIEEDLKNHKEYGIPCGTSIFRKMQELNEIKMRYKENNEIKEKEG